MSITKRDSSIDVLKIFATFCVISVHFFLNNGFYSQPVTEPKMYLAVTIRTFFMVCVPLFMITTGHLMCKKTLSGHYYKGITKTLVIYVFASIAHIIYKHNIALDAYTFKRAVLDILNFKAANYSWYIEMYIGLFLVIPFLNLIYNGLSTKKQKQALLLTCFALASIPTILNTFSFTVDGWWKNPASSLEYTKLVPGWWTKFYPVMYYFIGCYLREYRLSFSKIKCFALLAITLIAGGAYNIYRSHGTVFQSGKWADWDSPITVVLTVMVYMIITDTKWINNLNSKIKSALSYLADLTLGAYLVSYIFDVRFYPKLISAVPNMTDRLPYYFIMVPVVFVCSMLLSAAMNLIYSFICLLIPSKKN